MAKVRKNPHKARNRKEKTRLRVQSMRARTKKREPAGSYYESVSEEERLEMRAKAEKFSKALGIATNMPPEEIEETKVRLRFDLLFNTHTLLEGTKTA